MQGGLFSLSPEQVAEMYQLAPDGEYGSVKRMRTERDNEVRCAKVSWRERERERERECVCVYATAVSGVLCTPLFVVQ
jgi:hypothetical protein